MYKELYENKWTDAEEYLTQQAGKNDLSCTEEKLLHILICAKKACETDKLNEENSTEHIRNRENNKAGIQDDVTKKNNGNIDRITSSIMQDITNQITDVSSDVMRAYVRGCVAVCWYVCHQLGGINMFMDDPELINKGENLDKYLYSPYAQNGDKISCIIWPALFSNENNKDIIYKGVAKCYYEK